MATKRTSEEFLNGLAFHLELGGEINEASAPKLLEAIEAVEAPNGKVGEIKGVLETLREAGFSERLAAYASDKIKSVLAPAQTIEPVRPPRPSGPSHGGGGEVTMRC